MFAEDADKKEMQELLPPARSSKSRRRLKMADVSSYAVNSQGNKPKQAPDFSLAVARANRTPLQLARQEKCFLMNIEGKSIRAIAEELNLAAETVRLDVQCELELRAGEIAERRDFERERSLSSYDNVIFLATKAHAQFNRLVAERGTEVKITDKSLDVILKAQERKDRLQGLDAAIKIDVGITSLLAALDDDLPD